MADGDTATHSGIFSDERVMQFFMSVKGVVIHCFETLHQLSLEKSRSIQNDDDTRSRFKRALHLSFNVGLSYISRWDESIHEQEAVSARKRFPAIEADYKYTLIKYVKLLHRRKQARLRMKVPPFRDFLYWMLKRISVTDEMRTMSYFDTFQFSDKDTFLREMLRQTLNQDCLPRSELSGGGGNGNAREGDLSRTGSSGSRPAAAEEEEEEAAEEGIGIAGGGSAASAARAPSAPPGGAGPEAAPPALQPDDSISNVIAPTHVTPRYSHCLRLTPSLLRSHLERCKSVVSSAAPEGSAPPSAATPAQTKNIVISPEPGPEPAAAAVPGAASLRSLRASATGAAGAAPAAVEVEMVYQDDRPRQGWLGEDEAASAVTAPMAGSRRAAVHHAPQSVV